MTAAFFVLAGLMLLAALALVLRPLLLSGTDAELKRRLDALDQALRMGVLDEAEAGRKRKALLAEGDAPAAAPARIPALTVALLIGLGATLTYRVVGSPEALDAARLAAAPAGAADAPHGGGAGAPDMDAAIAQLAERMAREPDDLQGWLLLGRAYKATGRYPEARAALERARALAPEDVDVDIELAEALALSDPERDFAGEPLALLEAALAKSPEHERGLWLRGIAHAQVGEYAAAVARWERLLAILPPDAEVAPSLREQINEARARAGMPVAEAPVAAGTPAPRASPAAAPAAAAPTAATAPQGAMLTVKVDITPELKARLAPSDVLFVFARAPEGSRMPLAMQRLPASALPVTVTLDDSMGMMPALKLSSAERVVVGARVSKSGVANPRPGDFEALSAPIVLAEQALPLELTIGSVIQ